MILRFQAFLSFGIRFAHVALQTIVSTQKGETMNDKYFDVYLIKDRGESNEKVFWPKVGAAFLNSDSSLNVVLDAIPVNGRLHIRERNLNKTNTERKFK